MAVAIGSASVHLAVQFSCKANASFVKGSSCFGNNPLCSLGRRRLSSSATRIIPRASSATAVEMNAPKNLGLNVVNAKVYLDSSGKHNKFAITKVGGGYQESSSQLAMGVAFGVDPPKHQVDVDIATHKSVYDDGRNRSLLSVESLDRPGLLVVLVKIITDINVHVESGEFDTEGLFAMAKFHVSYKDKAISKPLQQVN